MEIGFYSGSFDPFTVGHLHVTKEALRLCEKVVIGIREGLSNVTVITYEGLTVKAALDNNATLLIRGIRNNYDYLYEENMAIINKQVSGLDTIYLRAGDFGIVSSSMVMEFLKNGVDVSEYLPKEVLEVVMKSKV